MAHKGKPRPARTDVDRDGRTPLHYAASDGNADAVRALIERGMDPSASDKHGWTPLHFAAQSHAIDAIALLLAAGAVVDAEDEYGNTPLFRATFASRGRGEVIGRLRAAGADPLRCNRSGVSPLALARTIANYPVAQFYSDLS